MATCTSVDSALALAQKVFGRIDLVVTGGDGELEAGHAVVGEGHGVGEPGVGLDEEVLAEEDAADHAGFDAEAFGAEGAVRRAQDAVGFYLAPGGVYVCEACGGEGEGAPHPALLGLLLNRGFFFEVAGMFDDFSKAQVGSEGGEYGKHQ